jgi:hypothetical protein
MRLQLGDAPFEPQNLGRATFLSRSRNEKPGNTNVALPVHGWNLGKPSVHVAAVYLTVIQQIPNCAPTTIPATKGERKALMVERSRTNEGMNCFRMS